jgi:hypothetical protein
MGRQRTDEIRDYLIRTVSEKRRDVVKATADHFGITRQAVSSHLRALIQSGVLTSTGRTRARQYALKALVVGPVPLAISPALAEDTVWNDYFSKPFSLLPRNVLDICYHGFTEMLNNAVDHSEGQRVTVGLNFTAAAVEMAVDDDGVGIFRKIKDSLHLDDERHAILELAKGKMTTDPQHHTGEGIFFTSRMFDRFSILAGGLLFDHKEPGDDWLIETQEITAPGTLVQMRISTRSTRTTREVFARYEPEHNGYGFTKTHVPVDLVRIGQENLVSRSQAKRLLARFERFEEVMLDFNGVKMIGQAFADEIFRVFRNNNPKIRLVWINAAKEVEDMIRRAINNSDFPTNGNRPPEPSS